MLGAMACVTSVLATPVEAIPYMIKDEDLFIMKEYIKDIQLLKLQVWLITQRYVISTLIHTKK